MRNINIARRGAWLGIINHVLVALIAHLVFIWLLFRTEWKIAFSFIAGAENTRTTFWFYAMFFALAWLLGRNLGKRLEKQGAFVAAGLLTGLVVALCVFSFWVCATKGDNSLWMAIYIAREFGELFLIVFPLSWLATAWILHATTKR